MNIQSNTVLALLAAAGMCLGLAGCSDDGFDDGNRPTGSDSADAGTETGSDAGDHSHDDHDHADHDHDHDHAEEEEPAAKEPQGLPVNIGNAVYSVGGVMMTLPPAWESVPVTSTLKQARRQYVIPGDGGQGAATVYVGSMGPKEMNIERWVKQIVTPDGEVERREHHGPMCSVVEVVGHGEVMATMGAAPEADYTLMALLIEGGHEGDMYIKAVGPTETMKQYEDNWQQLVDSIVRSKL